MGQHPYLGNLNVWRSTSAVRVKGNLVAARPRYLRERWGPTSIDEVVARLDQRARALLCGEVLPFRWYPMALMAELDAAIIDGPMRGDVAQMKAFGREIARYDLSSLYKMLFRLGTPGFVVKRLNIAYAAYIQGGSVRVENPAPNRTRVTLSDTALPRYMCTQGISGWITAALELSGARQVQVHESDCVHDGAPVCVWQGQWS